MQRRRDRCHQEQSQDASGNERSRRPLERLACRTKNDSRSKHNRRQQNGKPPARFEVARRRRKENRTDSAGENPQGFLRPVVRPAHLDKNHQTQNLQSAGQGKNRLRPHLEPEHDRLRSGQVKSHRGESDQGGHKRADVASGKQRTPNHQNSHPSHSGHKRGHMLHNDNRLQVAGYVQDAENQRGIEK